VDIARDDGWPPAERIIDLLPVNGLGAPPAMSPRILRR